MQIRTDKNASGYVLRRSLAPATLAPTLAGLLRSPEIAPLAASWIGAAIAGLFGFAWLALALLALGLGTTIWGCAGRVDALAALNQRGELVGGLRMRINRRRRTLWIMGLFVEPELRRSGTALELVAAALERAQAEFGGQGKVIAYAPTHAASKRIVGHYFGGRALGLGTARFEHALASLQQATK